MVKKVGVGKNFLRRKNSIKNYIFDNTVLHRKKLLS